MKTTSYTEYKSIDLEGIDKIPINWKVQRAKTIMKEINEKSEDGSELLLSVSEYTGVKPKNECVEEGDFLTHADTLEGYKKCKPNDLVMNIMLAWKRGQGVTDREGIVSPSYAVFRPDCSNINPRYLHYLTRSDEYIGLFGSWSYGIIPSRWRLYPEVFLRIPILLPPVTEQMAISLFLDNKIEKIDRLIEKKVKMIELLLEKRIATINHAVSKGLDSNAPMMDSGIEWLGEIPEHWDIIRLKYCVTINDEVLSESTDSDFEFNYIDIGNVDATNGIISTEFYRFENAPTRARRIVRGGDAIISTVRTYLRAIATIPEANGHLIVSTGFAVIRPHSINPLYMSYLLKSTYVVETIVSRSTGVSYPAINASEIGNIYITKPSEVEQQVIVDYLKCEINRINSLITGIKKSDTDPLIW